MEEAQWQAKQVSLADVELASAVGLDYVPLRDTLAAGNLRAADDATRANLIRLAGPGAVKRGYVDGAEVTAIPAQDLKTMDALWHAASGGKFGYSVQARILAQAPHRWARFFRKIGWVMGPDNTYRKWPSEFVYSVDAPQGHLPLTNTLRGTHLLQALMDHPALAAPRDARKKGVDAAAAQANSSLF